MSPSRPHLPSRSSAFASHHDHTPVNPSGLRQSYTRFSPTSSEDEVDGDGDDGIGNDPLISPVNHPHDHPAQSRHPSVSASGPTALQHDRLPRPNEATALLRGVLDFREDVYYGPCNHGTLSPRPTATVGGGSQTDGESGSWRKRWASRMESWKMTRSTSLAERHGVKDSRWMYFSYYLPVLVWARQYKWSYLKGDMVAALTMASMYVPMALSLADNLAHVPAIHGLYSFVFNPFMYALLGSCPSMVVGPEAAGSLLVGSVVKASVNFGYGEDDGILHAKICGDVAGVAGAIVFLAGVARLGFLDSVLSRPFLRGFISAIGVVICVDQLVPELGLAQLAKEDSADHGSSVDKLRFIVHNLDRVHGLTLVIAASSFALIMTTREIKRRLQPRYPNFAYFPDRFIVVLLSTVLAYRLDWQSKGVAILGNVEAASGQLFTFQRPLQMARLSHIREAMGTSFLIALLGFFESSVAAKSLGPNEAFNIQLSANREMVALGAANLLGACFMSLPAFGGYGRSKVNKSTGGKSPMSSVFLSLLTLTCILFLLPYFYYLPKPVLSALISVVAWSLVEECPEDVIFFIKIRGWTELGLMLVIVLSTIFYSLTFGIAVGVGLSLLQVIRHATRPRIQILGRIPGTNRFENAEDHLERLEFFQGCLIIKIPEPLTFANTGELKTRLRRLELYGSSAAHPSLPRLRRPESSKNIVFDIHGVTSMDGSGTQVLEEIVGEYRARGVRVFFSRGPPAGSRHPVWLLMDRSGIVSLAGGRDHFVGDVQEALKLTEREDEERLDVETEEGRRASL